MIHFVRVASGHSTQVPLYEYAVSEKSIALDPSSLTTEFMVKSGELWIFLVRALDTFPTFSQAIRDKFTCCLLLHSCVHLCSAVMMWQVHDGFHVHELAGIISTGSKAKQGQNKHKNMAGLCNMVSGAKGRALNRTPSYLNRKKSKP